MSRFTLLPACLIGLILSLTPAAASRSGTDGGRADPLLGVQWYLRDASGTVPESGGIGAIMGWEHVKPAEPIVVALLDSGVNWTHPDLARNIWLNRGEAPSVRPGDDDDADVPAGVRDLNGKDDDGNGYVDDIHGWDFASGDYNPNSETYGENQDHGTAMAGLMAAIPSNGVGLAGVGRNIHVMPLRVVGDFKANPAHTIPEAIRYAIRNGARVIVTGIVLESSVNNRDFLDAIEECDRRGILFIWAAGGIENIDEKMRPLSRYGNVLIVGGSKRDGSLLDYGDACKMIQVAAPAVGLVTSCWGGYQDDFAGPCPASAIVAGAAATFLSQHPEFTPARVIERIRRTSTPHRSMPGKISGGLLNLEALLRP